MKTITYLDHAATSCPKPDCVIRAVRNALTDACGNPGRAGHPLSMRASSLIYRTRETVARFFGLGYAENVLFFPNATYALNTVLHGLLVPKSGREIPHVLVSEAEHNAVIRPLHDLAERGLVTWEPFPVLRSPDAALSDEEIVSGVRARMTRDTALVVTTHISNVCGVRLPIRELGALCRQYGALFCVDASQSAGIYDIDMVRDRIDYLCTAGHKALLGPQGSGLLLLGEDAPIPRPLTQGGNGVASLSPEMPDFLPEALEAGTLSTPNIAGLGAGIRFLSDYGLDRIRAESYRIHARLTEILCGTAGVRLYLPAQSASTVLAFTLDGHSSAEVADVLGASGVCVRAGYHCAPLIHTSLGTMADGCVRASVGWGNTLSDCERFYKVLREVL